MCVEGFDNITQFKRFPYDENTIRDAFPFSGGHFGFLEELPNATFVNLAAILLTMHFPSLVELFLRESLAHFNRFPANLVFAHAAAYQTPNHCFPIAVLENAGELLRRVVSNGRTLLVSF